jgi:hypothetical protein
MFDDLYIYTGDDDKLACIVSYIVLSLFYLCTWQYALKNKNDRESRLKCVPHWRTCIQYSSNRQEAITSLVRFFFPQFYGSAAAAAVCAHHQACAAIIS